MPVQIAVIGAGHWGPNLIRNFHGQQRSQVRWVVDINPTRIAEVQQRFPDIAVSDDPAAALNDEAVDAVVVATPTKTHHELALAALQNGKHVLVEKPLAATSKDAEQLLDCAREAGRTLMVGHVFLYNPAVLRVKAILEAGDLGKIHYISMVRTNLGPVRTDVDAAWDLAAQDVSISNSWLQQTPEEAAAVGGSWINQGVRDAVFATLFYPENVLVHVHVSWLSPRKVREITVVGSRRMLTFDDMNLTEPVRIYDKGVGQIPGFVDTFASFRSSLREGDIVIPRVPMGEPLRLECDHFLECIETGREPRTAASEAIAVVRVLEAIQRSADSRGQKETVR